MTTLDTIRGLIRDGRTNITAAADERDSSLAALYRQDARALYSQANALTRTPIRVTADHWGAGIVVGVNTDGSLEIEFASHPRSLSIEADRVTEVAP